MQSLMRVLKNFTILLIISVVIIYAPFCLLWYKFEWFLTFGWNFRLRGIMYSYMHPWFYILIVSSIFSLGGSLWIHWFGKSNKRTQLKMMMIGLIIVIFLSGIGCSLMWQIHDMKTAYMPEENAVRNRIIIAIVNGISDSPIVYLTAFPINIFGTVIAYKTLRFLSSRP